MILFIADYSGHGVKVAINAAISKSIVDRYVYLLQQEKLDVFFSHLNDDLFKYISRNGEFCTAFACIIDLKENCMQYCNASHPLPILIRHEKLIPYENTENFFLGYDRQTKFIKKQVQLEENDRLFFYSDGVTEVIQNGEVVFNEKNLKKALLQTAKKNVNDSFQTVMDVLHTKNKAFPLEDDCTMIMLQRRPLYRRTVSYRTLESMERAMTLLRRELYRHEFLSDDIERIVLCFSELFINAIRHGNKNDPKKRVVVTYEIHFKGCILSLSDEGEGHAPLNIRHPVTKQVLKKLEKGVMDSSLYHGRGLWMVKRFSNGLRFNSKGNQVTVRFESKKNAATFLY